MRTEIRSDKPLAVANVLRVFAAAGLTLTLLFGNLARAEDSEPPIVIALRDQQFVPNEISAPAGKKFTILVKNESKMPAEFESTDFHREKIVVPGHEVSLVVGPLQVGTYEFFNDLHRETRGHLRVQ